MIFHVSETSKNSSAQANSDSDSDACHASDDEIIENVTEDNCTDAAAESVVENCKMPDHSNSVVTAV